MQISTAILMFFLVWWVLFFISLPFGQKGVSVDQASGAPKIAHLRRKLVIVSVISLTLTLASVWGFNTYGELFFTWAEQMSRSGLG